MPLIKDAVYVLMHEDSLHFAAPYVLQGHWVADSGDLQSKWPSWLRNAVRIAKPSLSGPIVKYADTTLPVLPPVDKLNGFGPEWSYGTTYVLSGSCEPTDCAPLVTIT